MIIKVNVKPKSKTESIEEVFPREYCIRLKEKAEDGKANKKLINLLAKELKVSFKAIKIKNLKSKNKVVEIFNPSDVTLNLAGFFIKIFPNGNPVPIDIALSGTIPSKGTFVVTHPQADKPVRDKADMASGKMNFDGNDAIVLARQIDLPSRSADSVELIDIVGEIGVNPGNSGWDLIPAGSTKDHDLRRKYPVNKGDPHA